MILRGERSQGGITLSPLNGGEKIIRMPRDASKKISAYISENICVDCPAFEISCKGAGRVDNMGLVREKQGKKIVTDSECRIPQSRIPYLAYDIGFDGGEA